MKTRFFFWLLAIAFAQLLCAQNGVTQCGVATNQPRFPLKEYVELPDPHQPDAAEWKKVKGLQAAWGSSNVRYAKHSVPTEGLSPVLKLTAWRGETVSAQALTWSAEPQEKLSGEFSKISSGKNSYSDLEISCGWVRYVMTDNSGANSNCGDRSDHTLFDSMLVADVIDHSTVYLSLPAMCTQGHWFSFYVPEDQPAGTYKGQVLLKQNGKVFKKLPFQLTVLERTLPDPSQWAFHLDLWQNPYAVARYYQVPVWSDAHLEAMRPLMCRLARAGQKVITASIMHKPWNGQTEDYFESMVTWTRRLNGSWEFNFDVFDRWVTFMMSCGIDQQINCYSMIPWALSFQYFDQATNQMQVLKTAPGKAEYEEVWVALLRSFSKHLKEKGWFNRCTIAMDERPMEAMQKTLAVIRKADADFKVSLAGNYHKELATELYDYCIPIRQEFPSDVLDRRHQEGKVSTFYTCCAEVEPNTFTFSEPTEATWLGYYAACTNLNGYLRWAYNSWVKEPLLDSRFRTWAGGDTYLIYPKNRTSIRFEKLVEGIQAYEKIRILREEFKVDGETEKLQQLEDILTPFDGKKSTADSYSAVIEKAGRLLNQF